MFQEGELDLEIKALKTKYTAETDTLEKLEPVFSTIKRLKALIQEKNVAGYRGILLDFIDVDVRFSACVDLTAKSKLFSIIVDDLDSAREVLKLNSQIKGGVVNIYPLSTIDDVQVKQRKYPESNEVMPLAKQVKLREGADPRISKLVSNIFSKVVLVRNYQLAMEVAREFSLTCITPDLQIVYAGAFITRVGQYNKSAADRVSSYGKVAAIQSQVELKIAEKLTLEKQRDKAEDKDLEAMRRMQRAQVSMNSLKGAFQQFSSMQFEMSNEVEAKKAYIRG